MLLSEDLKASQEGGSVVLVVGFVTLVSQEGLPPTQPERVWVVYTPRGAPLAKHLLPYNRHLADPGLDKGRLLQTAHFSSPDVC